MSFSTLAPPTLIVPQVYFLDHHSTPEGTPIPGPDGRQMPRYATGTKAGNNAAGSHQRSKSETFGFPLPPASMHDATTAGPYDVPAIPTALYPVYPLGSGLQARQTLRRPLSMAHLKSVTESSNCDPKYKTRTIEQWRTEADQYSHSMPVAVKFGDENNELSSPELGSEASTDPPMTEQFNIPIKDLRKESIQSDSSRRTTFSSASGSSDRDGHGFRRESTATAATTVVSGSQSHIKPLNISKSPPARPAGRRPLPAIPVAQQAVSHPRSAQTKPATVQPKMQNTHIGHGQRQPSATLSVDELYGADSSVEDERTQRDTDKILRLKRSLELLSIGGNYDFSEAADSQPSGTLLAAQSNKTQVAGAAVAYDMSSSSSDLELERAAPSLQEQIAQASDVDWSVDQAASEAGNKTWIDDTAPAIAVAASAVTEQVVQKPGPAQVVVILRSPALEQTDLSPAEVGSSWSRAPSFNRGVRQTPVGSIAGTRRNSVKRRTSVNRASGLGRRVSHISTITEDSPILSGAMAAANATAPASLGSVTRTLIMSPVDVERLFGVPLAALSPQAGATMSPVIVAEVADANAAANELMNQKLPELPSVVQDDSLAEFSYLLENDWFENNPSRVQDADDSILMRKRSKKRHAKSASMPSASFASILPAEYTTGHIAKVPSATTAAPENRRKSYTQSLATTPATLVSSRSESSALASMADEPSPQSTPKGITMTAAPSISSVLDRARPKTGRADGLVELDSPGSGPVIVVKSRYRANSIAVARTESNQSDATIRPHVPLRKVSKEQLSQRVRAQSIPVLVAPDWEDAVRPEDGIAPHVNPHEPHPLAVPRVSFAEQGGQGRPMSRTETSRTSISMTSILRNPSLVPPTATLRGSAAMEPGASAGGLSQMSRRSGATTASSRSRRQSHTSILRGPALDDLRHSCHAKAAYIRAALDARRMDPHAGIGGLATPATFVSMSQAPSLNPVAQQISSSSKFGAFASRKKKPAPVPQQPPVHQQAHARAAVPKSRSMPSSLVVGKPRRQVSGPRELAAGEVGEYRPVEAPRRQSMARSPSSDDPLPALITSSSKTKSPRTPTRLQPSKKTVERYKGSPSPAPTAAAPPFPTPPHGAMSSPERHYDRRYSHDTPRTNIDL